MLTRSALSLVILFIFAGVLVAQQGSPVASDLSLSFGDPKAQNRIEVFYDFQCGSCVPIHQNLKKIVELHPARAFVVIRHYPLQIHERAFMASSVVEAAKRQGKGLQMVDLLLDGQTKWSTSPRSFAVISDYATKLGLDIKRLQKDMTSDEVVLFVVRDLARGKRLEVDSTPTAFLNGKKLTFQELSELEEFISKGN